MKYIGQEITSLTNTELVAGKSTFVDDLRLPETAHLAVLRSPYAHARIRSIDSRTSEEMPGVLCVLTGAEIAERTNPIPEAWDPAEVGAKSVRWYSLCPDRVRFVGEAVAAVVAEDRFTAHEALASLVVDYEELPVVVDPEEAMKPEAPLIEPDWGENLIVTRDFQVGEPDAVFEEAGDRVVRGTVKCNRVTGASLEPRGVLAAYDPYTGVPHRLGLHPGSASASRLPGPDASHPGDEDPRRPTARRGRFRAQAADVSGGAARRVRQHASWDDP